jgi:hypothetical protein
MAAEKLVARCSSCRFGIALSRHGEGFYRQRHLQFSTVPTTGLCPLRGLSMQLMVGMQGLHGNLPGQMLAYAVQQREGVCAAAQCHKNSPDTLPANTLKGAI